MIKLRCALINCFQEQPRVAEFIFVRRILQEFRRFFVGIDLFLFVMLQLDFLERFRILEQHAIVECIFGVDLMS